eukprot:13383392-Alexandrium_andersonii.AAC.1
MTPAISGAQTVDQSQSQSRELGAQMNSTRMFAKTTNKAATGTPQSVALIAHVRANCAANR